MLRVSFDVDAVYCISLEGREDRRKLFNESIGRMLANSVNFHIVKKNPDPKKGCYESHQYLARLALEKGFNRILVFEDDVMAYPLKVNQVKWINRFMHSKPFEALHLGYSMGKTWLTWFPFIARGNVVALHAYVLSKDGCKILAETPYGGTPVDVVFKRKIKQHCAFPMLFRQHAAELAGSDLENTVRNEDDWWERNWRKHLLSPIRIKNILRTLFRVGV